MRRLFVLLAKIALGKSRKYQLSNRIRGLHFHSWVPNICVIISLHVKLSHYTYLGVSVGRFP